MEIKGKMKEATVIPDNLNEAIVNGSIYKFKVKDNINPYYSSAFLMSPMCELQKEQNGANSIINYLSKDIIKSIIIPLPSKKIQDNIGNKIKRYQEKIYRSRYLIKEAKQDVEDLIEGKFTME